MARETSTYVQDSLICGYVHEKDLLHKVLEFVAELSVPIQSECFEYLEIGVHSSMDLLIALI